MLRSHMVDHRPDVAGTGEQHRRRVHLSHHPQQRILRRGHRERRRELSSTHDVQAQLATLLDQLIQRRGAMTDRAERIFRAHVAEQFHIVDHHEQLRTIPEPIPQHLWPGLPGGVRACKSPISSAIASFAAEIVTE